MPRELVRALARPLTSEPARPSDAASDLRSEMCSPRLEDGPREPERDFARPLV